MNWKHLKHFCLSVFPFASRLPLASWDKLIKRNKFSPDSLILRAGRPKPNRKDHLSLITSGSSLFLFMTRRQLQPRGVLRRQHSADERQREKSDEDFKNKYPFNLCSFISCRLKTLMKQFFKLKWFIFKRWFSSHFSAYLRLRWASRASSFVSTRNERQIGSSKFFISARQYSLCSGEWWVEVLAFTSSEHVETKSFEM